MSVKLDRPVLLTTDNFTPLTRTPWAGKEIVRRFKPEIHAAKGEMSVGESWEFSCDPNFPSHVQADGTSLIDLVQRFPNEVLSPPLARGGDHSCEILVKLLNADSPLSLQVHPKDDDPALKPGECGKPESWYVLHAEPGAGLYLGFSKPVAKNELRTALLDGDRCRDLLHFVPVKPGDYFEITPGVPHAVGPGVTLLEPQRILFGKTGKTYRMWDWGRRYNPEGRLDMEDGRPRELHVEESLRLVNPLKQVGDEFVATTRRQPVVKDFGGASVLSFPANPYYRVTILSFARDTQITLTLDQGYAATLVISGKLTANENQRVAMGTGQSALLPFAAFPLRVNGKKGTSVALVTPAIGSLQFIEPN